MEITRSDIERLIKENRLTACFECGKCTASCPLCELFGDLDYGYTPKGIIEKALLNADLVTGDAIWYCLTCDVCTKGCPCGVRLRDFIEALRRLVVEAGYEAYGVHCRHCDQVFLPDTALKLVLATMDHRGEAPAFLHLCPRCRSVDFSRRVKESLPGGRRVKARAGR